MRARLLLPLVALAAFAPASSPSSSGRGGITVIAGHHPFDAAVCIYTVKPDNLAESEFTFAGDGHPMARNYPDEAILANGLLTATTNGPRLTITAIGTYQGKPARITAVMYDGAKDNLPDSLNIMVYSMENVHLFHLYGTVQTGDFVVARS